MTMRRAYALLAVLGFVAPYYYLVRFLAANGLNLPLFVEQLLANDISIFFAVDLIIASVVFLIASYREARRLSIPYWWICLAGNLLVGLSFALPLFLYLREGRLERPAT